MLPFEYSTGASLIPTSTCTISYKLSLALSVVLSKARRKAFTYDLKVLEEYRIYNIEYRILK